mgnify:CR=1 FL=1
MGWRMKNKVYVVVSVPMIDQEFDMYLPVVKKVGAIKKLIIRIVEEESDFNFVDDGCKNLYDKETGNKIDDNEFLKYSKIKNGTRLLLY